MFDILKAKVDLYELVESTLQTELVPCGTGTFEPHDKTCPFCGHRDCFRVKYDPENLSESMYKCFSCDETGTVIDWELKRGQVDTETGEVTPYETLRKAGMALAKRYGIQIPTDYTPVQEIFDLAAKYYHSLLMTTEVGSAKLSGYSPLMFQLETRGHTREGMEYFQVGWSDGSLVEYLSSLGFEDEIIEASGLKGKRGDFLPADTFIYPHFVNGRASHFTFKDPLKRLEYQLPNKFKLNGYAWYGQDDVMKHPNVLLVEGENDRISAWEGGWTGSILATIGQLSGSQVEWLGTNATGKDIVSMFDNDDAGNKYRDKLNKIGFKFSSLVQYTPVGVKDIDQYLKEDKTRTVALAEKEFSKQVREVTEEEKTLKDVEAEVGDESRIPIIEKDRAYYKVTYKDGEPKVVKVSNFIIKLRNIYIQGQDREREIIIEREDGRRSAPVVVKSEVKVSLKPFKTLVANAIDASFYGSEADMSGIWEKVYSNSDEREVHLPQVVGRLEQYKGWLFRDCFIADSGEMMFPDAEGVYWIGGSAKVGLKALSLSSADNGDGMDGNDDIPQLVKDIDPEDRVELLHAFTKMLAQNLGDIGTAITMVAWFKANAWSNTIFRKYGFFPFLYFWGRHGKGKTHVSKWLLSLYGMHESGYTTVGQLKSGVGLERKVAYYGSLPICIDECRSDRDTADFQGTFRAWYNRSKRVMGIRDGFGVKEKEVLSTFIFSGEDQFSDSAARQRCIPVRIAVTGRELVESYEWIENHRHELSSIGMHWITESVLTKDKTELLAQIEACDKRLTRSGVNARTAKNWAVVAVFGEQLAAEIFPGFNYRGFIDEAASAAAEEQKNEDYVQQFFTIVEGMQVGDRPMITQDHVLVEDKFMYLWFAEIHRKVKDSLDSRSAENFSRNALLQAIREEDWCSAEEVRREIGCSPVRRRCIKVDLESAPDTIKNIAAFYGGAFA